MFTVAGDGRPYHLVGIATANLKDVFIQQACLRTFLIFLLGGGEGCGK